MDASGKRCYTQAGIRELTRRLASTGRSVQFTVSRPPVTVQLMDERWRRLTAGCAVVTDVSAAADGLGLVVQIWQRG
jgi:ribosomal protein S12 methylthiotransferase accessory factor YcaO